MNTLASGGLWALAIAFGVMAGVYFTFSAFVMSSLGALPNEDGIAAMQSINEVILESLFMPLFAGTTIASVGLTVWGLYRWGEPGSVFLVLGGAVYFVGMFACTAAFNVPLNNALAAVDTTSSASLQVWSDYLRDWTRWNHGRTLASALACALLLLAERAMP